MNSFQREQYGNGGKGNSIAEKPDELPHPTDQS